MAGYSDTIYHPLSAFQITPILVLRRHWHHITASIFRRLYTNRATSSTPAARFHHLLCRAFAITVYISCNLPPQNFASNVSPFLPLSSSPQRTFVPSPIRKRRIYTIKNSSVCRRKSRSVTITLSPSTDPIPEPVVFILRLSIFASLCFFLFQCHICVSSR